eukprot:gb/GFBE01053464.1/.p1 GENE.gb/GFBE01053464.1/~~gb/GFBE01053464.1/.p1  ORF type:complete len:548 (+),score=121.07 gb/GFBE01053464.1/:1-1644(+)
MMGFHAQLQALAAEYDRVVSENSELRQQLGSSSPLPTRPPSSLSCAEPGWQPANMYVAHQPPREDQPSLRLTDVPTVPGMVMADEDFKESHKAQKDDIDASPLSKDEAETAEEDRPQVCDGVDEELEDTSMRGLILLDIFPALVIMVNAVVTGVSADHCLGCPVWDAFEIIFTIFFAGEIAVKMKLFGPKKYLCSSDWYWSWFDIFCVALAVFDMSLSAATASETASEEEGGGGLMGVLKMLKLARLGRIVRLLKFKIFVELKLMIQGVFTGLRVLFWAVVLLVGMIYLLGVIGKTLFGSEPELQEFSSVPAAMFTWFRCFTDGCSAYDGTPLQERLFEKYGIGFMIVYILLFLFITIGIFNLIMAVFIDNVNDGSMKKKQYSLGSTAPKTEYMLSTAFSEKCMKCLAPGGPAPSAQNAVSEEELETMRARFNSSRTYMEGTLDIKEEMQKKNYVVSESTLNNWLSSDAELLAVLDDADIDLSAKFDLFDVLDADLSGALEFDELIAGLMKCRGPVSKNDIIAIRNKCGYLTKMITEIHDKLGLSEK